MKHSGLYFVCPTDCLEYAITRTFGNTSCYYTSIGNSVVFNKDTTRHVKQLILKHDLQEIAFVLSNTNPIIRDALENQHFYEVRGLDRIYNTISAQKTYSDILWQKNSCLFTILSHYLNKKIKELRLQLDSSRFGQIQISGMIYNQSENVFHEIYSDLICRGYFSLN